MYRLCLIAMILVIFLVGCNAPTPEQTAQDPNVTPEGVRITPDVVYGHKFGMALTFDMYQPENQNGAGVILINSGAWVSYFPNAYEQIAEGLRLTRDENGRSVTDFYLDKGFTVFWVRHGSSPKFEMAEIVADLRRAIRFIRFNVDKYGIDAERLGLWGISSGGHLALLLGTTSDIGNPDPTEEFENSTGRVAAVVAYCPPTHLKSGVEYLIKNGIDILKVFPALNLTEEEYRDFSPIFFASSDDPPILIIHGDQDKIVPMNYVESMYQALQESGVKSKFVSIPGAGHEFEGEDANLALTEAVSWFEKYLVEK